MGGNLSCFGSGLLDRVADTHVSHATAQIPGHDGIDVLIGRGRKVADQRHRLHDLARLAVTTLRDLKVGPRLLHRMPALGIEPFDGGDLGAGDASERRYAGARRSAADMDGAGAAHSDATAELRSGEAD